MPPTEPRQAPAKRARTAVDAVEAPAKKARKAVAAVEPPQPDLRVALVRYRDYDVAGPARNAKRLQIEPQVFHKLHPASMNAFRAPAVVTSAQHLADVESAVEDVRDVDDYCRMSHGGLIKGLEKGMETAHGKELSRLQRGLAENRVKSKAWSSGRGHTDAVIRARMPAAWSRMSDRFACTTGGELLGDLRFSRAAVHVPLGGLASADVDSLLPPPAPAPSAAETAAGGFTDFSTALDVMCYIAPPRLDKLLQAEADARIARCERFVAQINRRRDGPGAGPSSRPVVDDDDEATQSDDPGEGDDEPADESADNDDEPVDESDESADESDDEPADGAVESDDADESADEEEVPAEAAAPLDPLIGRQARVPRNYVVAKDYTGLAPTEVVPSKYLVQVEARVKPTAQHPGVRYDVLGFPVVPAQPTQRWRMALPRKALELVARRNELTPEEYLESL